MDYPITSAFSLLCASVFQFMYNGNETTDNETNKQIAIYDFII